MSEKLRILFVSSSSGSQGGGELYLIYLGKALRALGHEVGLWVSDHERMDSLCQQFAEVGEVIRSPYSNTYDSRLRSLRYIPSYFKSRQELGQSWLSFRPDVIHLNKQCLEDGLDLLPAADSQPVPHLTFLHITQSADYLKAQYAAPRDWISRLYLKRYSGHMVTHSNRLAELQNFIGRKEKALSVDNGVSIPDDAFYQEQRAIGREALGVSEETCVILGVGRIETQKRPDRFRTMAHQLQQKISGSRVAWVGAGRLEHEWDAWTEANGVDTSQFQRLGWKQDALPYLAAADIYLHPAGFEGMPFSLLEAMAWRNPCIMMDELADELQYFGEDSAIIASEGDNAWLQRALDPAQLDAVAQQSLQVVQQHFSIEKMAREYESLYRSLMSK